MDNATWKAQNNYRGGEFAVEYCGGCQFADHSGNQFTCSKAGGMVVEPGGVCDLFRANGDAEFAKEFVEVKEGQNARDN